MPQHRKHTTNFPIPTGIISLAIGLLGLLVIPALVEAQVYVEPEGPPPQSVPNRTAGVGNDPALEFLNGSTARQQTTGSLLIGERNGRVPNCNSSTTAGCSRLCLNPNSALWTNDPTNCITQWGDIAAASGGPFVRLLSSTELGLLDRGFMYLKGIGAQSQLVSLISVANPATAASSGIRSDSTSTSHWAAQFQGQVLIQPESGTGQLCLNGTCITQWSEAVASLPDDAIRLQSSQFFTPQAGNVGLNGPLLVGSLVAGTPAAGTSVSWTCGDGLCSSQNNETSSSCSADCL